MTNNDIHHTEFSSSMARPGASTDAAGSETTGTDARATTDGPGTANPEATLASTSGTGRTHVIGSVASVIGTAR